MEKFNPRELPYCRGCAGDYCASCVQDALESSYEGRLLSSNKPRFEYFHWEDVKRFREFIGDDMDPVRHGLHQAIEVAIPFIEHQQISNKKLFTQREAKMVVLGNVLHDAHEGLTGDVALPDKTDDTYETELKTNLEAVRQVMHLAEDDPFLADYRSVVGDLQGWSFAGRAFNAIEWCGYFLSGIKAWSLRHHELLDDDEQQKSYEMGYACIIKDTPVLQTYAEEFAYPAFLLKVHHKAIEEAHRDKRP